MVWPLVGAMTSRKIRLLFDFVKMKRAWEIDNEQASKGLLGIELRWVEPGLHGSRPPTAHLWETELPTRHAARLWLRVLG